MLDSQFMKYMETIVKSFKAKDNFYVTITNGHIFVYEGISLKWITINYYGRPEILPEYQDKIYGVKIIKLYAKAMKDNNTENIKHISDLFDLYGGLPMFDGDELCSYEVRAYNFIQKTKWLIYKCTEVFNLIENNSNCSYKCRADNVFNTIDPIANIGSMKSEDGAALIKLSDNEITYEKYDKPTFITMFKGLVPYNSTDIVNLIVYSINYNDFFMFIVMTSKCETKFYQLISTLSMA